MYTYFGGVTPILVSDNCATAINRKQSDWYTPELNRTYYEFAEHYSVAILPARVRRPKDKPNVEGSVGKISTWITAALKNEQFFSLAELNSAIQDRVRSYNAHLFQKKECSRLSLFLGEEKPLLAPLPATPFELAEWKQATVQFNYHIAVETALAESHQRGFQPSITTQAESSIKLSLSAWLAVNISRKLETFLSLALLVVVKPILPVP